MFSEYFFHVVCFADKSLEALIAVFAEHNYLRLALFFEVALQGALLTLEMVVNREAPHTLFAKCVWTSQAGFMSLK